ncbi:MAG TPA: M48 family metallopeptidase [Vicinamibacterales bacterium]|nr:M48 family metallopeptidase [Vicinamibacterales bacterium]
MSFVAFVLNPTRDTSIHATILAIALALAPALAQAQTRVTAPPNNYTPAQDVEMGQKAAANARKTMPLMHDDNVTSFVQDIGRRLVGAIPQNLDQPLFQYTFEVVNVKEINAFALPGGPMFVNRGMVEAARTDGEVAGVMAHELSHVLLRHGTAQASKASRYGVGQIAGSVLGAIVGGGLGQVISQGTQFGLGTAFLRFSREYERDADIEGAQIMARAGYDPNDMANIFKTIQKQGGSNGPQWLSDHPDPGDRSAYIAREALSLPVANPIRATREFDQVQSHLKQLPPAPATQRATRTAGRTGSEGSGGTGLPSGRVEPPSSSYQTYTEGNAYRISVPSNWRELPGTNAVTFAPEGAYGTANGRSVFTHGVEVGSARSETHDLRTATDELLASLAQSNPGLSRPSGYDRVNIGGRQALRAVLSNTSSAGQPENIVIFTSQLRDGALFYAVAVAPRADFSAYGRIFDRVITSIELID